MKNTLLSREDVLERIGATDFRSIKQDQLIRFVSSIPEMDKELAIKCIEQFPEFNNHSKEIITQLTALCDNILKEQKDSHNDVIVSYKLILDDLHKMLDQPDISQSERELIIEKMVYVADKISDEHHTNSQFLQNVIRIAGGVGALSITLGAAILGVKIGSSKKLP